MSAKALGVDPQGFFDLISGGPLDMGYLHAKAGLILGGRLMPPSFAVETAEKDARLIVQAGERHGVRLDVAAASAERFARAARRYGDFEAGEGIRERHRSAFLIKEAIDRRIGRSGIEHRCAVNGIPSGGVWERRGC